jgi:hypothetical protein
MSVYDIKTPTDPATPPQLRMYTIEGPRAFNLRAYRIQSDQIVSYIVIGSDVVETNLGPCSIANSVGFEFRATEIDNRIKATLDASNAP